MNEEQFEKVLHSCRYSGGGYAVVGHHFTIEQIIKMYVQLQMCFIEKGTSATIILGAVKWWEHIVNCKVRLKDRLLMKENIPFIFEL